MQKIISATDARKNFFQLLRLAGKPKNRVIITLEGNPPVIMLSQEEFDGWMETLDIMSNPKEAAAIRAAMEDKDAETIALEELEASIGLKKKPKNKKR